MMRESIKDMVDHVLRSVGFVGRGMSWYRERGELLHVVELQKSKWGNSYYINIAIWVKCFGKRDKPKSAECHIQSRIDFVPDAPHELEAALDEEDYWRMDADQRQDIIELALLNAEAVFFNGLSSVEDIRKLVCNPPWPNLAIAKQLRESIA